MLDSIQQLFYQRQQVLFAGAQHLLKNNGMALGKRLKAAIEARKTDQVRLAEKSGVPQPNISALIVRDSKATADLYKLADALALNPRWLLNGEGDMEVRETSELSDGAYLIGLVWQHLPQEAQDDFTRRLLTTGLAFVPATHPQYKRLDKMYRATRKRERVRAELRGKA